MRDQHRLSCVAAPVRDPRDGRALRVLNLTGTWPTVHTTWNGASGIDRFFEGTFAPISLRRIYDSMLGKLAEVITG